MDAQSESLDFHDSEISARTRVSYGTVPLQNANFKGSVAMVL